MAKSVSRSRKCRVCGSPDVTHIDNLCGVCIMHRDAARKLRKERNQRKKVKRQERAREDAFGPAYELYTAEMWK